MSDYVNDSLEQKMAAMIQNRTTYRERLGEIERDENLSSTGRHAEAVELCEKAKAHISVCLSGEGGDEVFVGYDRYKAAKIARFLNVLPRWVRHNLIGKWTASLKDRPEKKGPVNMFKRFMEGALLPEDGEHVRWQYFMNARFEQQLFQPNAKNFVIREYSPRFSFAGKSEN